MHKVTINLVTLPPITIEITDEEHLDGVKYGDRIFKELQDRGISYHEFNGTVGHTDPNQKPIPLGGE